MVEGEKALDVGSGSGYLTACMALLVGKSGKAVGIDHIPELVEYSIKNVMSDHPELLESGVVKLVGKLFNMMYVFRSFRKEYLGTYCLH